VKNFGFSIVEVLYKREMLEGLSDLKYHFSDIINIINSVNYSEVYSKMNFLRTISAFVLIPK
jgi:hypothetical protein